MNSVTGFAFLTSLWDKPRLRKEKGDRKPSTRKSCLMGEPTLASSLSYGHVVSRSPQTSLHLSNLLICFG